MKKTLAYLAAAVAALFWAADGRAQNLPDDAISAQRPYLRSPVSGRQPNSFFKLSTALPLNDFELSGHQPKSSLRIAEELPFPDNTKISGLRPNSFTKISTQLPERITDDIAKHGFDPQVKISGRLPASLLKISSQYPTQKEN
jgi:hypothetical protein